MVLNLWFFDLQEKRIVTWHRDDFVHNGGLNSDYEMIRTVKMIKGKEFNLDFRDDPNRKMLSPQDELKYAELFKEKICTDLDKITEGLIDEQGQISRRLERMKREGKIL